MRGALGPLISCYDVARSGSGFKRGLKGDEDDTHRHGQGAMLLVARG